MNEDAAGELVSLGLTQYEARAYLALIGRDDGTPAEIARIGNIPRPRAYDVLASLAERGIVAAVSRAPSLRYRAKPPETVFQTLLAVRRRDLDRLATRSEKLASQLQATFLEGQNQDEPLDYVEVLRDKAHTLERISRLWEAARDEVLAIVRPPYIAPPSPEDATVSPARRNRAIYERSLLDDPRTALLLQAYADLGEEIRIGQDLPLKLTVIDSRTVAFNMPDPVGDESSVTTIVVHHADLASTLRIAFETLWDASQPLADVLAAREQVPG